MLFSWSCLILLWLAELSQQSGFSSPDFVTPYGSGAYENVIVWYVGQTKKVTYDISGTGLEDYTIALWQQSVSGGGASLGPVVNSKLNVYHFHITKRPKNWLLPLHLS